MSYQHPGSYQHRGRTMSKKAERERESFPLHPYKEKGKGERTKPEFSWRTLSPRACAPAYARGNGGQATRYRIAGGAADELSEILGAAPGADNRRLWAFYCYHHDVEIILDRAREIASRHRQGELRDPVRAFQRWLSAAYPKGGAR